MSGSVAQRRADLQARFTPWQPLMLHDLLDKQADTAGDLPYVITDDATYTFNDIRDWSIRLAQGLCAVGVEPGDHVGVVLANFPEFVALKYAISRAHAVTVPINFLNRRDELGYVVAQSDVKVLITMDTFRGLDYLSFLDELEPTWREGRFSRFPALTHVFVHATGPRPPVGVAAVPDLELAGRGVTLPGEPGRALDACDILYTSGTTGHPKGVVLTHDMVTRTAYGSAYSRAVPLGHRITFSLPMYHVYGYIEGMLVAAIVGGCIVPQLSFSPADTLRAIEQHDVNDVLLVPTMTLALIDELGEHPRDLPTLSTMISSGGYSPPWIWGRIREVFGGLELTTGYGMSETTATTTLTEPGGPDDLLRTNGRQRPAGVAGDPKLDGSLVAYRVVDPETGRQVGVGEVGELRAWGPGVTPGYYRKPDETAAAFDEQGWFRSGDLGSIDSSGSLVLVGRAKDVYRCGGEQVVPKEIEDVLIQHPGVSQAHVVPLRDERMGEVGVAWIVIREGHLFDEEALRTYCTEHLARFKVPRHFLSVAAADVPVTPSGRPRKFLLAEKAALELAGQ